MHFLVFEANPKPTHPDYGSVDGAFVSVFVNETLASAAETAGRALIEDQGWDVAELDQSYSVQLDTFPIGHPSRATFEQALIDGIAATFHRWPVGAPDDDEENSDGSAA